MMSFILGVGLWLLLRFLIPGFYTVAQNELAVKSVFGKARKLGNHTTLELPMAQSLSDDEKNRYVWPQLQIIQPGGPYFKMPWEVINKASTAINTASIAMDPDSPTANHSGAYLEAVTKDHLNTNLTGQIRFSVSGRNLYPVFFGIKNPISHTMGFLVSILRERIANFEAPEKIDADAQATKGPRAQGISINDLRKNLSDLNAQMEKECLSSEARYGICLTAALITGIDPPPEVESALAAINTAYNQVSSEVSLAQAAADQKIVQSKRAVEIETFKAEAETQTLRQLAEQLTVLKKNGADAVKTYVRNVKLELFSRASKAVVEVSRD
jgi:regulator of protease activity HflC (stomatin/prohibitin superfamily)